MHAPNRNYPRHPANRRITALPIDPLDVDSIAAGIDRVAEDGSLRSELRALGLAQAACFSWDDTARSTWSVLQAALENAR